MKYAPLGPANQTQSSMDAAISRRYYSSWWRMYSSINMKRLYLFPTAFAPGSFPPRDLL